MPTPDLASMIDNAEVQAERAFERACEAENRGAYEAAAQFLYMAESMTERAAAYRNR